MSQKTINIEDGIISIENSDNNYVYDVNQVIENKMLLKEILYQIGQSNGKVISNKLKFDNLEVEIYEDHFILHNKNTKEEKHISNFKNTQEIIEFLDYLMKKC